MFIGLAGLGQDIEHSLDEGPERRPRDPAWQRSTGGEELPVGGFEVIAAGTATPLFRCGTEAVLTGENVAGKCHFLKQELHGAGFVASESGDFRGMCGRACGKAENDFCAGTGADQGAEGEQQVGRQSGIGRAAHAAEADGRAENPAFGENRIRIGWRRLAEEGN